MTCVNKMFCSSSKSLIRLSISLLMMMILFNCSQQYFVDMNIENLLNENKIDLYEVQESKIVKVEDNQEFIENSFIFVVNDETRGSLPYLREGVLFEFVPPKHKEYLLVYNEPDLFKKTDGEGEIFQKYSEISSNKNDVDNYVRVMPLKYPHHVIRFSENYPPRLSGCTFFNDQTYQQLFEYYKQKKENNEKLEFESKVPFKQLKKNFEILPFLDIYERAIGNVMSKKSVDEFEDLSKFIIFKLGKEVINTETLRPYFDVDTIFNGKNINKITMGENYDINSFYTKLEKLPGGESDLENLDNVIQDFALKLNSISKLRYYFLFQTDKRIFDRSKLKDATFYNYNFAFHNISFVIKMFHALLDSKGSNFVDDRNVEDNRLQIAAKFNTSNNWKEKLNNKYIKTDKEKNKAYQERKKIVEKSLGREKNDMKEYLEKFVNAKMDHQIEFGNLLGNMYKAGKMYFYIHIISELLVKEKNSISDSKNDKKNIKELLDPKNFFKNIPPNVFFEKKFESNYFGFIDKKIPDLSNFFRLKPEFHFEDFDYFLEPLYGFYRSVKAGKVNEKLNIFGLKFTEELNDPVLQAILFSYIDFLVKFYRKTIKFFEKRIKKINKEYYTEFDDEPKYEEIVYAFFLSRELSSHFANTYQKSFKKDVYANFLLKRVKDYYGMDDRKFYFDLSRPSVNKCIWGMLYLKNELHLSADPTNPVFDGKKGYPIVNLSEERMLII